MCFIGGHSKKGGKRSKTFLCCVKKMLGHKHRLPTAVISAKLSFKEDARQPSNLTVLS